MKKVGIWILIVRSNEQLLSNHGYEDRTHHCLNRSLVHAIMARGLACASGAVAYSFRCLG